MEIHNVVSCSTKEESLSAKHQLVFSLVACVCVEFHVCVCSCEKKIERNNQRKREGAVRGSTKVEALREAAPTKFAQCEEKATWWRRCIHNPSWPFPRVASPSEATWGPSPRPPAPPPPVPLLPPPPGPARVVLAAAAAVPSPRAVPRLGWWRPAAVLLGPW